MAVKRKKFLDVEIPITNTKTEIYAYDLENLENRKIKLDLTRQLRGKSIELVLEVKVKNNKATAEPKKLKLLSFFIRRMLRKGTNYVEDSFSTESKNALLRVKPFLITRKKVPRKVRKALRDATKNFLITYIKERKTDEIFSDIITNQLQKTMSLKLKKVYPLSLCEIRVLKIEKDKAEK